MVLRPEWGAAGARLAHPRLILKRPWFSLLGRKMYVYAPNRSLLAYVKRPLFKLRDEFTIYADESETQPLLLVKARSVIGINMSYDVIDCASKQRVGTIRSRGWESIFRDTYDLLDEREQPVGVFVETGNAMLRRLFPFLLGEWNIEVRGQTIGRVEQVWQWFEKEFTLDLSANRDAMDPRFAVALTVFALIRESRREQNG
ncbi:MAG: hypothetical protein JNK05_23980 [Myxococcales bacterium]|nr:hypothetical protein [Myxococcales bacterium]